MPVSESLTETAFWARFVLAVLATWRMTHLLASEDGPADIIVRFRALLGQSIVGKLMDCFNCLSLWIAAPAALFVSRKPLEWFLSWLALSGGACLLERIGQEPVVIQPVSQPAGGDSNDVLRSETHGVAEQSDTADDTERPPIRRRQYPASGCPKPTFGAASDANSSSCQHSDSKCTASGLDGDLNAALFDQCALSGEVADPSARARQRHEL
jgi:hypothetical protein